MMRKLLFSFIFCTFSVICFSQVEVDIKSDPRKNLENKFSKYYFSEFLMGLAIPAGDFARTDPENAQSGFADPGGYLFAGYGRMFREMVGLEAGISVNFNPVNSSIDQLKKLPYAQEYNRDAGWVIINYLAGPRFSFPAGKFAFDARLLAGLMDARRPSFKNSITGIGYEIVEEKVGHGYAVVYQLGAGIKYQASKKISIKLMADYFKATPTINYQETASVWGAYYGYYFVYHERKYKQPVSAYNIGFGIDLHF
jgi:hypothetical protein